MPEPKTCSRGHRYEGPGGCPVCWSGNRRKGAKAAPQAASTRRRRPTAPKRRAARKRTGMAAEKTGGRPRYAH